MQTEWNNQTIEIRPFRDEDREAIVAFSNHGVPAHRRDTVVGWEEQDAMNPPERVALRLVVGDPAIAYLAIVDQNTTIWKMKDVCRLDLRVAHDHRRQGIGSALYEKAMEFARSRGAKRVKAHFEIKREDEPAIAFLTKRGFTEMEREQPSVLALTDFDPDPLLPFVQRAEDAGIRFYTYADAGDTDENRRRIYDLFRPLDRDVPHRDSQEREEAPFEQWVKHEMGHSQFRSELLWLAEKDGQWIGASHLWPRRDGAGASQALTGVLREHRGQGIATALKVKAYIAAKAAGVPVVTTENHEMNAPMLAVNKKFGFVPEAPEVTYNKVLAEEEPHADSTKN